MDYSMLLVIEHIQIDRKFVYSFKTSKFRDDSIKNYQSYIGSKKSQIPANFNSIKYNKQSLMAP